MFCFVDLVQPTVIETPKVREAESGVDTNRREFRNGTVIELTCTGQIGSDHNAVGHYSSTILKILNIYGLEFDEMITNLRRFNIFFFCRLSGGVQRQQVPRPLPGCRTQQSTL